MDAVVPPMIVWCGRFNTHDGYGMAARLHVGALRGIGANVVAVDIAGESIVGPVEDAVIRHERTRAGLRIVSEDPAQPVHVVVHERPDRYPCVRATGLARRIGYSYWETSRTPPDWVGRMLGMDRIWTSSDFNVRGFEASGLPDGFTETVGHPVDPLVLDVSEGSTVGRRWPESTVFLSVMSSTMGRRDLSTLVEAFITTFDRSSDVALVVKVPQGSAGDVRAVIDEVEATQPARAGFAPPVYTVAVTMSREQLLRLHASVDCYVSCERGNGWDLPAMDSLALGVPVVATGFGASSTFLDPSDCYLVPTSERLVSADASLRSPHALYSGHEWPYVDPAVLGDVMRNVREHPDERRVRARQARDRVLSRYSAERVARDVVSLVQSCPLVQFHSAGRAAIDVCGQPRLWSVPFGRSPDQRAGDDDALLGILSDDSFIRPWNPAAAFRVYKSASNFAVERRGSMVPSKVSRLLSDAMARPTTAPLSKGVALARLWTAVRAAERGDGGAALTDVTRETLRDYEGCVAGSSSAFTPLVAERRRRDLWRVVGPIPTNESDLARLDTLQGRHRGERVFVLGNGPSLLRCDLSRLGDEYTFAVNRIHLLFNRIEWRPTFYTLLDWKMGATMAPDIHHLAASTKFFPERVRGVVDADDDTYWYWERPFGIHADDHFEPDVRHGIPSRSTVLVTAIQLACHLGFDEILLVGVDATYSIPMSVRQVGPDVFGTGTSLHLESTADDDPNHFDPSYFGRGARWHDPNPLAMRRDLSATSRSAARHGHRVRNATAGGALDEIERVDLDEVLGR